MAKKSSKKTAKPTTLVLVILDESSSMMNGKEVTMTGFNRQVEAINAGAKSIGNTFVTLVTFANTVNDVFSNQDAKKLMPLGNHNYNPCGCTALYDAIWHGCQKIMAHPDVNKEDTAILVNIITDGEENSSQFHNATDVAELKDQLEKTGRWTFTLMGPKDGLKEMSQILNFNVGNVTGFAPSSVADRDSAMKGLVGSTANYMCARSAGVTQMNSFYQDHNEASGIEVDKMTMPKLKPKKVVTPKPYDQAEVDNLRNSSDPKVAALADFFNAVNGAFNKKSADLVE